MAEKETKGDSKERVAFDLMKEIAYAENYPHGGDPRKYYLTLYRQCWLATTGYDLDAIYAEVQDSK